MLQKPKRAATAWLHFVGDFRQQNTGLAAVDAVKQASVKWKSLSTEDRQHYRDRAAQDKEKYDAQMAAYLAAAHEQTHVKPPAKPPTAFLRYIMQYAEEHPDLESIAAVKAAAHSWKSLSACAKAPYQQAYDEAKALYMVQLAECRVPS